MPDSGTISKAREDQAQCIRDIVAATITEVYSKYYPDEVVRFFLELHSLENIRRDILAGKTYVIRRGDAIGGTGTVDGDMVTRVYVLPEARGTGVGSALMDELEKLVIQDHGAVRVDASLPAVEFYRRRRYDLVEHAETPVANGRILSYAIMRKRRFDLDPAVYNAPSVLVGKEIALAGLDMDEIRRTIPGRVYLLADSLFDAMLERNAGTLKYDVGGGIYVMNRDARVGFAKGEMCSPGIATQAEDLFAAGVRELIHVGFAGGRVGTRIGDYVVTDGAYHDTAVAGLYGVYDEIVKTSGKLTDALCRALDAKGLKYHRGYHWTTDAGYVVPDWSIRYHEEKGVKCLEMEGAGLFSVAKFRGREATGVYVISDAGSGDDWDLGWGEEALERSVRNLIDAIIG